MTVATNTPVDPPLLITQTLNGVSYSLRASPPVPWFRRTWKAVVSLVSLPVMIPASCLWCLGLSLPFLHDRLLGFIIPRIMQGVDTEFQKERQTLLQQLQGNVLDVGSGGGAYLKYCSKASRVVAVEPNTALHPRIRQEGEKLVQRTIGEGTGVNTTTMELEILESMNDVMNKYPSHFFDYIILGNVLCEVPCVVSTLKQVGTLLQPDTGVLYFCEHIGCTPTTSWQRWIQNRFNPVWRYMGGGCNCNRDSLQHIQECFENVIFWKYTHLKVCMGPFVLGLAMNMRK